VYMKRLCLILIECVCVYMYVWSIYMELHARVMRAMCVYEDSVSAFQ
jgi:hypothetical protein